MYTASVCFQRVQTLWVSLIMEDSRLRAEGPLIKAVNIDHLPGTFEPSTYGIDPRAVDKHPKYRPFLMRPPMILAENMRFRSLPDPTLLAKRPADSPAESTTSRKMITTKVTSWLDGDGTKTPSAVIKQEDTRDEEITETSDYATWQDTEQGRDFDVSFEAFESIKSFLQARN
ncbi:hypothetical protein BC567DRAFT_293363 [Phyllosticta citribraziliensis]